MSPAKTSYASCSQDLLPTRERHTVSHEHDLLNIANATILSDWLHIAALSFFFLFPCRFQLALGHSDIIGAKRMSHAMGRRRAIAARRADAAFLLPRLLRTLARRPGKLRVIPARARGTLFVRSLGPLLGGNRSFSSPFAFFVHHHSVPLRLTTSLVSIPNAAHPPPSRPRGPLLVRERGGCVPNQRSSGLAQTVVVQVQRIIGMSGAPSRRSWMV